jgi:nucleotide-binding universal stress UspA family protein
MIKNIFVPASGSSTAASVFATALALARPLAAHLQFLHMHPAPSEAAIHAPHVEFCQGPAIGDALEYLRRQGDYLCAGAVRHFQERCEANSVPVVTVPDAQQSVTASWTEETKPLTARFMLHARHADLVVLGRPRNEDYMPAGMIESLLLGSGRPIVIAPDVPPRSVTGTIVVGWKETPEAARALAASLPLLQQASRVVLIAVAEENAAPAEALRDLARQLEWHRIYAEVNALANDGRATASQLTQAAAQLGAELLVVGGFGHGPLREMIFGGVTQALIEQAGMPVLLMH